MFILYWNSPGEFATCLRPRRQFLLSLLLSVAVPLSLWLCSGERWRNGDAVSKGFDRCPLPGPPAYLWGDHIPLHPWLSPTSLSIRGCLPHPGLNRLLGSKRDAGCRVWKIRATEQMVLDNPPSPPPSTSRTHPIFTPHFLCFSGCWNRKGSQNACKQDACRWRVFGSFPTCQTPDGTWWTNSGSKRTALCSGCLPRWVPS